MDESGEPSKQWLELRIDSSLLDSRIDRFVLEHKCGSDTASRPALGSPSPSWTELSYQLLMELAPEPATFSVVEQRGSASSPHGH